MVPGYFTFLNMKHFPRNDLSCFFSVDILENVPLMNQFVNNSQVMFHCVMCVGQGINT